LGDFLNTLMDISAIVVSAIESAVACGT
jgi:hypothetical protein